MRFLVRFLKFLVGIVVVVAGLGICVLLWKTRPRAVQTPEVDAPPVVDTAPVAYGQVELFLPSQGVVESVRRTRLAAEVSGKIVSVSDKFESGEVIGEGEVLLTLEDADYQAAVEQARSTLATARLEMAMETARAEQAARDWKTLGSGGDPDPLVVRAPQVLSAEAKVAASVASLERAQRDLERTRILSPFPATISETLVELGGFVTAGTPIAEIFQTTPFEVRLPLSLDEALFLQSGEDGTPTGSVEITAAASGVTRTWKGTIVRSGREIDRSTRSVYLVAEFEPPPSTERLALQPGLFVTAEITGRTLPEAARVPSTAFLDLDTVVLVDLEDRIRFHDVDVLRREDESVLIAGGLPVDARLCLTEIPGMTEGMRVSPREEGEEPDTDEGALTVKP